MQLHKNVTILQNNNNNIIIIIIIIIILLLLLLLLLLIKRGVYRSRFHFRHHPKHRVMASPCIMLT